MKTLQVSMKNRVGCTLRGIVTLPETNEPVPFVLNLHAAFHHRQNMCMCAARAEGGRGRGPDTWRPFGGMSVQHTHEPSYR